LITGGCHEGSFDFLQGDSMLIDGRVNLIFTEQLSSKEDGEPAKQNQPMSNSYSKLL